jgi:hypothetical protein
MHKTLDSIPSNGKKGGGEEEEEEGKERERKERRKEGRKEGRETLINADIRVDEQKSILNQMWWLTLAISALRRPRRRTVNLRPACAT